MGWRPRFFCLLVGISIGCGVARAAEVDCSDCQKRWEEIQNLRRSSLRLESIMRVNEEFIAGLQPGDESERIKARSNLSIAAKRLSSLTSEIKLQQQKSTVCRACGINLEKSSND